MTTPFVKMQRALYVAVGGIMLAVIAHQVFGISFWIALILIAAFAFCLKGWIAKLNRPPGSNLDEPLPPKR